MAEIYLDLLIGICIAIVGWSLIRLERIYQYPFFMASIFISFILPQAVTLVNKSFGSVVSQAALERVLLYSCMCAAMCWVGYQYKPKRKLLAKLDIPLDESKLLQAGILLLVIGHLCFFLISRITIQTAANGSWTGPATILFLFGSVVYIALPVFLLKALKRPNFINITLTLIAAWPIVLLVLGGRRQTTVTLLVAIGLSLFLVRRYIPPRGLLVAGVISGAYLIPVIGLLRGKFWTLFFNGDWQTILSASQQGLESIEKGDILELRNAALMMDAAEKLDKYSYGTGLWDSIIFQFVPGQIVGFDVKASLQFNLGTLNDLQEVYGYKVHPGTTPTGMGDSFVDFSYFGCLTFVLMGLLFKTLWVSSVYRGSVVSSLLYIALIDSAMLGVTHGIGRFCQELIFKTGVIFLITYFCRKKTILNYLNNEDSYFVH